MPISYNAFMKFLVYNSKLNQKWCLHLILYYEHQVLYLFLTLAQSCNKCITISWGWCCFCVDMAYGVKKCNHLINNFFGLSMLFKSVISQLQESQAKHPCMCLIFCNCEQVMMLICDNGHQWGDLYSAQWGNSSCLMLNATVSLTMEAYLPTTMNLANLKAVMQNANIMYVHQQMLLPSGMYGYEAAHFPPKNNYNIEVHVSILNLHVHVWQKQLLSQVPDLMHTCRYIGFAMNLNQCSNMPLCHAERQNNMYLSHSMQAISIIKGWYLSTVKLSRWKMEELGRVIDR